MKPTARANRAGWALLRRVCGELATVSVGDGIRLGDTELDLERLCVTQRDRPGGLTPTIQP